MIEYISFKTKNKKIIAVGNPPYQENNGVFGKGSKAIYPYFMNKLIASNKIDIVKLVLPARWFSSMQGRPKAFRVGMVKDGRIKTLTYFERSHDIFPTVRVQGGICFIHWDKNHRGQALFRYKNEAFSTDLAQFDIILDDPFFARIVNKILDSWDGEFIANQACSTEPFGIESFYFKRNEGASSESTDAIKCYTKGRKINFIKRTTIKKNSDKIDDWKVAIPKAYAPDYGRFTLPPHQIFLIEKGAVCTGTYNILCSFKTKAEAEKLIAYLGTNFARYLLGLRKFNHDIPKDRWSWVPCLDLKKDWNDEKLFAQFGLSKEEQEHIEKKIEEWS